MNFKKVIVTTTINYPSEAILKFAKMKEWKLVVVGDLKTPHKYFNKIKNIVYLSPQDQVKISRELSDVIGWNCVQRRNFGFLYAKKIGANIIATVDDDNIPYKNWGKKLLVNKDVLVKVYGDNIKFFDPISVTEHKSLWHRGFPIQLISKRRPKLLKYEKVRCLIQADFWNGDPDVDAICRIAYAPNVKFKKFKPFTSRLMTPFNSQNTFISRKVIDHYYMLPNVGRMDDIWGAYMIQNKLRNKLPFIVFSQPTVFQKRNFHDYLDDLNKELNGYKNSINFYNNNTNNFLPKKTVQFVKIYSRLIKKIK